MVSEKLSICLVSTGYPPEDGGGIGTYTFNLAMGLKEDGHRVVIVTQTRKADQKDIHEGIPVYRYKSRYIPKLERLVPGLAWSRFIGKKIKALNTTIKTCFK